MKKVLMAAVAALTMVAFTSCDENAEHCYEVTTDVVALEPVVNPVRMTKKQAQDMEANGTTSVSKVTCKIVADSKCPEEDED